MQRRQFFCPRVKHPTVNGLLQLLAADVHAQIVVQATVRPRSVINVTHGLEPQSCAAVTCTAGCRWQPCDFAPYWPCSALNIKLRPKPPQRHKTLHRYGCSRQAAASAVKLQSYIQPNPKPPTLMSQPSPLSEKSNSLQGFPVHPYAIYDYPYDPMIGALMITGHPQACMSPSICVITLNKSL